MSLPTLRFAVPPSMGHTLAAESATSLQGLMAHLLGDIAVTEVYVADSYPALSLDLLHGHCDLAWGPPSVCARAEVHGARVLAQSLRAGASRYRSAIVGRRDFRFDAAKAAELRAAWVDADSTGGYLLACAWLRGRGVEPMRGLKKQRFYGSYKAAVTAVLDHEADITAVFANASGSARQRTALDELGVAYTTQLDILDFTPETPNDGLAARAGLDDAIAERVVDRFTHAADDPQVRAQLGEIFHVDGFVRAGTDEYRALHEIVMSSLG